MNIEQKERLAMTRDSGKVAAGLRIKAARNHVGISQTALGKECGITKAAVANIENGLNYPQRPLMLFFHRNHRIDLNFLIEGDYRQLPGDIQDALLLILESLRSESDQTQNSD